jgi:hypothetical protein
LLQTSIWVTFLTWMLPFTAAGTGLVMARFLYLMHRKVGSASTVTASASLPWLALAAASLGVPLIYGAVAYDLSSALPIVVAAVLAAAVGWSRRSPFARWVGMVPPGDILDLLMRWRLARFLLSPPSDVVGNAANSSRLSGKS